MNMENGKIWKAFKCFPSFSYMCVMKKTKDLYLYFQLIEYNAVGTLGSKDKRGNGLYIIVNPKLPFENRKRKFGYLIISDKILKEKDILIFFQGKRPLKLEYFQLISNASFNNKMRLIGQYKSIPYVDFESFVIDSGWGNCLYGINLDIISQGIYDLCNKSKIFEKWKLGK